VLALGVEDVKTVDPHDMKAVRRALKEATGNDALSVVIFRAPCVLIERKRALGYVVGYECRACGVCSTLGCPAISQNEKSGLTSIDEAQCVGCGQCAQYCAYQAIKQKTPGTAQKQNIRSSGLDPQSPSGTGLPPKAVNPSPMSSPGTGLPSGGPVPNVLTNSVDPNASNTTILLCGVGGQGTILAADLLARSALQAGFQVKLSEVHGMAQRGGAVTTVVRFGESVASMVTDPGCADHIIAFETTEALRNLGYLKAEGSLLVNDEAIKPLSVLAGKAKMPLGVQTALKEAGAKLLPATKLAQEAGNPKCSNVVMLGALAKDLGIDPEIWLEQIRLRLPAHLVEVNLAAFYAGYSFEEKD